MTPDQEMVVMMTTIILYCYLIRPWLLYDGHSLISCCCHCPLFHALCLPLLCFGRPPGDGCHGTLHTHGHTCSTGTNTGHHSTRSMASFLHSSPVLPLLALTFALWAPCLPAPRVVPGWGAERTPLLYGLAACRLCKTGLALRRPGTLSRTETG